MFVNSIDNKPHYFNRDSEEMLDFTKSIFKSSINQSTIFTYYRVTKDMEMRPDKISQALYGSIDYAEMVMKYSLIDNPFAIEAGDVLAVPSLTMVYTDVDDTIIANGNGNNDEYKFVKNYHKYIDKSKIPTSSGSSGSGDIYSGGNGVIAGRQILGSTNAAGSAELNVAVQVGGGNDLGVRQSYGNVMGYGSDYNLTDGNDGTYSGGYSEYSGVNNLDENGYPVRDNDYPSGSTSDSPSSSAGGNGVNPGYNDGTGSGKAGNVLNNDIYNGVNGMGGRGYGQGSGGSLSRPSSGLVNGISYDDDDTILTETLYDENGNEIPIQSGFDELPSSDYGPSEPNMANDNKPGITVSNGRIYFGDPNGCNTVSSDINDITDTAGSNKVDDPLVDCARTGISIGQFLNATTKNKVKGK